jgi:hypothetical protein
LSFSRDEWEVGNYVAREKFLRIGASGKMLLTGSGNATEDDILSTKWTVIVNNDKTLIFQEKHAYLTVGNCDQWRPGVLAPPKRISSHPCLQTTDQYVPAEIAFEASAAPGGGVHLKHVKTGYYVVGADVEEETATATPWQVEPPLPGIESFSEAANHVDVDEHLDSKLGRMVWYVLVFSLMGLCLCAASGNATT